MKKNTGFSSSMYLVNHGWVQRIKQFFRINRKHKDRLFVLLFNDPAALLQLYNAVNHSNYTDPAELKIRTLEEC